MTDANMLTMSKADTEAAFQEFLEEIDGLTINEDIVTELQDDCKGKTIGKPSLRAAQPKNVMIDRAEDRKQSWTEFKCSTTRSDQNNDGQRPPVSFTIQSKNKKKSKKRRDKKKQDETTTTTSGRSDSNNETKLHVPSTTAELGVQRPRWVAVIDTCALIERYDDVCNLIKTANHTAISLFEKNDQTLEPISIVIPYKIWTELDFQSKLSSSSSSVDGNNEDANGDYANSDDLSYKARRAVRMLKKEISNNIPFNTSCGVFCVIRSQSRVEMDYAAKEFLLDGCANYKDAKNDDHILCCARAEERKHTESLLCNDMPSAVGGVVLLTLDNVLSCKAQADGCKVYSPFEFVDYYNRRMKSLKERHGLKKQIAVK